MSRNSVAPLWLMGLTNSVFGMYAGVVLISVPQLLSNRQVPETTIAAMTAVMASPGFWTFLVSPVLDVRFSRRWYSLVCAFMAAALLVLALLNLDNLALAEGLLVAGYFFANLYQSALGGWLSSIVSPDRKTALSSWVTIGNVGGTGVMAVATGELVRNVPPHIAAFLLGAVVLLPTSVFPFMPAPGPDRRLARESFGQFFGEVLSLLKRREVLIAIVLFAAPAATFSLTNFMSGIGDDFHASSHFVSLVGGVGILVGGVGGGLLFRYIDRWLPLRYLYLAIGVAGSVFTFTLIVLPRTPTVFAIAFLGENIFQVLALTTSIAIAFETIGRNNPLAATIYCLITSAFNIPITYMLLVDGRGYAKHGASGAFAADASFGILASMLLGLLVVWTTSRRLLAAGALLKKA
jgi:MFS transporter, PAT family, beta-lactamase induction signal transducer AmpG